MVEQQSPTQKRAKSIAIIAGSLTGHCHQSKGQTPAAALEQKASKAEVQVHALVSTSRYAERAMKREKEKKQGACRKRATAPWMVFSCFLFTSQRDPHAHAAEGHAHARQQGKDDALSTRKAPTRASPFSTRSSTRSAFSSIVCNTRFAPTQYHYCSQHSTCTRDTRLRDGPWCGATSRTTSSSIYGTLTNGTRTIDQ